MGGSWSWELEWGPGPGLEPELGPELGLKPELEPGFPIRPERLRPIHR